MTPVRFELHKIAETMASAPERVTKTYWFTTDELLCTVSPEVRSHTFINTYMFFKSSMAEISFVQHRHQWTHLSKLVCSINYCIVRTVEETIYGLKLVASHGI